MPNTKHSITRLVVIDRCLSAEKKMTLEEILKKVNEELMAQQKPPVKQYSTIHRDFDFISHQWKIEIVMKPKGKEFTYQYEKPTFSIFKSSLTPSDLEKLYRLVDLIKDFTGLPQFEWLVEVSNRLQVTALDESDRKPIVWFMHNPAIASYKKHFSPLYKISREKRPIVLTYQKFNSSEARTYVVHPYGLKEFACRWYLVGSVDHHPGSISCFGFERIVSYKESDVPFRENTRDLDVYFNSMLGLTLNDDDEPQEVLLWVKDRDYPYLESNPIHESQKLVREENDGKVISLHICINYELVMRIFSYNIGVKVLAPKNLLQDMMERVKTLFGYYFVSDPVEELKSYYIV
jgi:predicted DNA-binding transcriptional regulator YafY